MSNNDGNSNGSDHPLTRSHNRKSASSPKSPATKAAPLDAFIVDVSFLIDDEFIAV